jgi:hypothetical protein
MAKKTRRARRQSIPRSTRPAPSPVATEVAKSSPIADSSVAASPAPRKQVDFSTEYHYVINDLRKMGILAAAMLVVLVALSFVIR